VVIFVVIAPTFEKAGQGPSVPLPAEVGDLMAGDPIDKAGTLS